ncbi:urea transporter [Paraburkholderia sabiae]|uniref:Urea transporter n=1 Tax=Paraburkholderia sabiae TaxID=273251 RepID=A0ABU9QMG6_9BURK|nr:urea transporter [Paraburkholderia sabiae]WJZ75695.1 urea transporter [Paraburkholderia sabiae]CAD6560538.1 Urea transporter [Paraburkholderia sabiae]
MSAAPQEESPDALRTLLRSFGQIVLQRNAATGACILAAWLVSDARLACAALTGAIAANVGAVLRGYDCNDTRDGLHGFNGALAALAAFTFISDDATAMAVAILAATAAAWLLGPWEQLLRSRGLGVYSSPCLLVTWAWLPFVHPALTHAAASGTVTWFDPLRGLLTGIAQTSFACSALAGALILGGIALSSMRAACFALLGAALATSLQWLAGANSASFDAGLLGFNGALVALAVADCGVLAALAGVGVSVALQQVAVFYGAPALTAPFVVATWTTRRLMRDTRRTRTNSPDRAPEDDAVVVHRKRTSRAALPER